MKIDIQSVFEKVRHLPSHTEEEENEVLKAEKKELLPLFGPIHSEIFNRRGQTAAGQLKEIVDRLEDACDLVEFAWWLDNLVRWTKAYEVEVNPSDWEFMPHNPAIRQYE